LTKQEEPSTANKQRIRARKIDRNKRNKSNKLINITELMCVGNPRSGVALNKITFIPSFLKIGQPFQISIGT
jgi:hypothetical protein